MMFKPTLLVDFDLTISPEVGFSVPPQENVVESITQLSTKYKIVIYSGRANEESCAPFERILMEGYLKKHSIHYDEIATSKPVFMALIDDRTFNPKKESWESITAELMGRVT
jgi:hypothetical protein